MLRHAWSASALLAALLVAGCSARDVEGDRAETAATCTRCHGGLESDGGAPPRDMAGNEVTTALGVGAHTAHVTGPGRIAPAFGCETCHVAPDPARPQGHIDGEPTVQLGLLASAGGVTPSWDRTAATCTVYCHGASLAGGADPAPRWTQVDGTQGDCGSCHGLPPPSPHPQRDDCARCHPDSLDLSGPQALPVALHLNGQVDLAGGCATCHGNPDRQTPTELVKAAPPVGLDGETETTELAVGAHEAHLLGGAISGPVPCSSCHAVPAEQTHADGAVQLQFGGVAVANGAAPVFERTAATCSASWCHGGLLQGGSVPAPVWTRVDDTQAACGACHGRPPATLRSGGPHPAGTGCAVCHPGTVDEAGAIRVANGMHVNGTVDVSDFHPAGWVVPTVHGRAANADLASCKACHGADLAGGATGISCATCHGATWQSNCAFCHGDENRATNKAAPPRGTQGELVTTERAVGAHQAHLQAGNVRAAMECAECHAVPTSIDHVDGTPALAFGTLAGANGATPALAPDATCTSTYCHGATLAAGGSLQVPLWTQVDGTQAACGTCHGLPPPAPHPQISTCRSCHPETMATDTTIDLAGGRHIDGTLQRQSFHPAGWVTPSTHGLAANADLASCRACHGADLSGGNSGVSCATCHGATWQSNCTFCHGEKLATYTPADLGKAAPPQGTQNETATTARAVGAHARHLSGGAVANGFACTQCHAVPADLAHVNGTPALAFGPIANANGVTSTFGGATCATWCHGTTLAGGALAAPSWTTVDGSQAACGACHGLPPATLRSGAPHSRNPSCGSCHDGFTSSSVNKALHVNGTADVKPFTCSSCHGDPARAGSEALKAAPPVGSGGETETTAIAVGAHQRHLTGGALSGPIACTQCHAVPTAMDHSDVTVDLAWGALATGGGAITPAWTRATATCSSTYCHGASLSAGGTRTAPVWTGGAGEAACGACHGAPPPAPHPQNPLCGNCHDGYTIGSVNLATHVDGQLSLKPFTCSSCHGDAARGGTALVNAAPPIGTEGETATSTLAVGAHAAHVYAPTLTNGYACDECHVVPASMDHPDDTVQVAFGTIATTGGATPAWDRGAATCSASYCHGAFVGGQLANAPGWTLGSSQATCGSCHLTPPPSPHVRNTQCGNCHPSYPAGGVNPAIHANGNVELLPLTCASCHGDPARAGTDPQKAAPPVGTGGETGTGERAVGAHQKHVFAGVARAFACSECHVQPASLTHPDGSVVLTWGPTSQLDGATPAWSGAALTCSSTYCHGSTLGIGGGSATTPVWTAVNAGPTACGSCHGAPPPSPHPGNPDCGRCHDGYGPSSTNAALHIDGSVDVKPLTCSSCHGDPARAGSDTLKAAPPAGTAGETETTARAVGAHQAHLVAGRLSSPLACTECHAVPTSMTHPDGPVQLSWGPLATRSGAVTPTWDGASCTNYCHGATLATGLNKTPSWTGGVAQAACGTCHLDPSTVTLATNKFHFDHRRLSCNSPVGECHPSGYTKTSVGLATHVNGVREASGNCDTCHAE